MEKSRVCSEVQDVSNSKLKLFTPNQRITWSHASRPYAGYFLIKGTLVTYH